MCTRTEILQLTLLLALPALAFAADESYTVTATRVERDSLRTPLAISTVDQDSIQRRQGLGIDESMNRIPGVFFQDRYNYAQDQRVSIRGFGARSQFGIRGIKIYVDGIPSTLPDGQGGVDDIELNSVSRIEVLRGPAAALYGASAGGVINLFTEDGTPQPYVEAGISRGEYDFGRYTLKSGGEYGALNWLVSGSYLNYDGYREHSEVNHSLINSKFRYDFADGSTLTAVINAVDSPVADDPGGLTAAQTRVNRKAAAANNLRYDSGEWLEQQKLGLVYQRDMGDYHHVQLRNYYIWREFGSHLAIGVPLPAGDGIVEFSRFVLGGGIQYSYDRPLFGHDNRLTIGLDIDAQEDDRQRYLNVAGAHGALSFDQLETAESRGFYLLNEFSVTSQIDLLLGLRYDSIDLDVEDRFLANGDQSDSLEYDELNPMIGVVWSPLREINLYANYGTAFETPSFTELANISRGNGTLGGFGKVSAQHAKSYEIGVKGVVRDRLDYDLALFYTTVDDEITPLINIGRRTFYDNSDTERKGLEASLRYEVFDGLKLALAYTYSDFTFERSTNTPAIAGNRLPGQPEHQFYGEVAYTHPSGFYAIFDMLVADEMYADNANTTENPAYRVANLRFGRDFAFRSWGVKPFFGINNLFNETYNQNVIINAANGRYFEPAPDRNVYGGVTARYSF